MPLRRLLVLLCLFSPVVAHAHSAYLARLQARAAHLRLWRRRYWHILLEYESNWLLPGVTSEAVTPWFFNAPDGRTDPKAELDATLAAFVRHKRVAARHAPAACVFIARYHWLDRQLHFNPRKLAPPRCPAFHQWLQALDPSSVSVVFPNAYINSPASMFGHTLLRIDSRNGSGAGHLLAYAVNYAADVSKSNGITFAIKGISGGYPGRFGLYPYYDKVKQYTRIENRDIWSYRLSLSHAQIVRMLRHLWELEGVDFPYYFFRSNCSFQLLALLESARPRLHLLAHFPLYAIPTDTLRVLEEQPGLVVATHYRPSRATRLRHDLGDIDDRQRRRALALAAGRLTPKQALAGLHGATARAQVLEVAHGTVAFRFAAHRLSRRVALRRARRILLARSRIQAGRVFTPPPRPAVSPARGHGTSRIALGTAWAKGRWGLTIGLRPAYHDLLDPLAGYQPGAQIGFLNLRLAVGLRHGDVRLRRLKLIHIVSITPRTAFYKPISWRVQTGFRRTPAAPLFAAHPGHLGYYLQGGPGLAWGNAARLAVFAFAMAGGDASSGLASGYRLFVGPRVGLLAHPLAHWALKLSAGWRRDIAGDDHGHAWVALGQQWQLDRNDGIRLRVAFDRSAGVDWTQIALSYRRYF